MSDGFSVDYVALGVLAQKLADLRGEFDKGADAVRPLMGAVGDDELRSKLEDFATNWSDRKEQVTKQLDSAAGFAKAAADCYRDTDNGLRDSFAGQSAPPGGR